MKILVVASDVKIPDQHGGSTHVQELISHLEAHGEVLLLASEGSHGEGIVGLGHRARRGMALMRHMDALLAFPRALAVAREFGPDVIYERCTSYGLGAMIGARLGVPVLAMVLDQRYSWLSLWAAQRLVATRLDLVPAPVRAKAAKVDWGANPARFDAALSGHEARGELGIEGDWVVGYAGTFRDWHGLDTLVPVARRLIHTNIKFLLIGDGPEWANVEGLAVAQGVRDRFVLPGEVAYDDVPRLLAAADACVAPFVPDRHGPSKRQGFILDPLKLFEYLALGKPALTIDADNIRALFEDGQHLRMVGPGDDAAMASVLEEWMRAPAAAAAMAARGRSHVLANYTWAAHARQLADLFEEMLRARAS